MQKTRLLTARFISLLPANAARVLAYKLFLGYKIDGARIGIRTVIAVTRADLRKCHIGAFNAFVGPMSLKIQEGASIGRLNTFSCGYWTTQEGRQNAGYSRSLAIGRDVLITSSHYFDVAGSLRLGRGSWVAGVGSQFWTHGAGVKDRDVRVGEDCYLGSAVRFAPGAFIGNNVLVAMGSVVTSKLEADRVMIGGVPAKILKEDYDWKTQPVKGG